jgi:hypothetical protein
MAGYTSRCRGVWIYYALAAIEETHAEVARKINQNQLQKT